MLGLRQVLNSALTLVTQCVHPEAPVFRHLKFVFYRRFSDFLLKAIDFACNPMDFILCGFRRSSEQGFAGFTRLPRAGGSLPHTNNSRTPPLDQLPSFGNSQPEHETGREGCHILFPFCHPTASSRVIPHLQMSQGQQGSWQPGGRGSSSTAACWVAPAMPHNPCGISCLCGGEGTASSNAVRAGGPQGGSGVRVDLCTCEPGRGAWGPRHI